MARCLDVLSGWIKNCDNNHSHCALRPPAKLPARVLDVGNRGAQNVVRLYETQRELAHYTSLSHCWGKKHIVTTTKATLEQRKLEVQWPQLSKTFQDAISITRALGIRYIWIDSLCIIQDDKEDWERESAKMAEIYSCSYLNLAATGSADGDGGCFFNRSALSGKSLYPVEFHEIKHESGGRSSSIFARRLLSDAHIHFTNLEPPNTEQMLGSAPLLTRAWVLQERFLTARTLHCHAAELVWECKESLLCECGGVDDDSIQANTRLKSTCAEAFAGQKTVKQMGNLWFDIISLYSRLKLSNESDRLPALSGLAKRFSDVFLGSYLGGLWEIDLPQALLWQACPSLYGNTSRTALQNRIPTWSWASVQFHDTDFSGFITYDTATYFGFEPDHRLSIIASSSPPSGLDPFGQVSGGMVELRGAFISTFLFHERLPDYTSSFLMFDRDEALDTVLVSKEDLIVDIPLYEKGQGEMFDGESLYCLLIGHTTRDMAREGRPPELSSLSLVLKPSISVPGAYERVGMLQSDRGDDWFQEAVESIIVIV